MGWSIGGREEIVFCEVSVSDTCTSAAEVPRGHLLLITGGFFLTLSSRMAPIAWDLVLTLHREEPACRAQTELMAFSSFPQGSPWWDLAAPKLAVTLLSQPCRRPLHLSFHR